MFDLKGSMFVRASKKTNILFTVEVAVVQVLPVRPSQTVNTVTYQSVKRNFESFALQGF